VTTPTVPLKTPSPPELHSFVRGIKVDYDDGSLAARRTRWAYAPEIQR
jgi:hypothetical protein